VKARGFLERPAAPVLRSWLIHLALGLCGAALYALVPALPIRIMGLLASCVGFTGIATLGHVASHNAALKSPLANRFLFYVSFPLLLQVSTSYWRYSHLIVHHPSPNVTGVDDDCDLRPVFALNEAHLSAFGSWRLRWPVLQGLLLLVLLPLNGLNIIRQGWVRLFMVLAKPGRRGLAPWVDLGCMALHLVLWLALPMLFFRPLDVLVFYLLRLALVGCGMFAVLAPGHYPAEAACLSLSQRNSGDFYLRQAATTLNFRTGFLGRFMCSGLEYQIEHHFFPSVSYVHLRAMQPMVQAWCEEHGIPYRRLGWGEAIWKSWLAFVNPKPIVEDVEGLRGVPRA
jgi:linoleoyl-CoA desaturase